MFRAITISMILSFLLFSEVSAQLNKAYFYSVGRNHLINNNYERAIGTLNVLLKVDKKAHEGYFLRGIAKYNLDDLLGAEADFSTAIGHNPVFTMAYQYRAITRLKLGNYDDALNDFQEAINLRPDIEGTYYSRGITYILSKQYDKAIKDFNQFIRHENMVSSAYVYRGSAYLYLKDTVNAVADYNLAIKTNRNDPSGYNRRGGIYMAQGDLDLALNDFNKAVECDTTDILSYFNRAIAYSSTRKLLQSLADFDKVIELDSTNSLTYFNRAIVRSQIGDYHRALDDYNMVAKYSPDNVLVYFNRALIHTKLGNVYDAINDYSQAIYLYPDFANAYLNRASIKYQNADLQGAKRDKEIADRKIADYRNKLKESTFSIYADTSRNFNQLLSFDTKLSGSNFKKMGVSQDNIALLPLFRFSIAVTDNIVPVLDPESYWLQKVEDFKQEISSPSIILTNVQCTILPDSIMKLDQSLRAEIAQNGGDWRTLFKRSITQSLIRQYTNSINTYNRAIEMHPASPFLYLNRSTVKSEMIDFISSIDNSYNNITISSDPASRLNNTSTAREYNYDEAISDLNKAIRLYPEFAHLYYNRANLQVLSGRFPEAYNDYTYAIKLWGNFPEAYYNRGLVQIFMKDTRKGCLDISKAGELGIKEAYTVLKIYSNGMN